MWFAAASEPIRKSGEDRSQKRFVAGTARGLWCCRRRPQMGSAQRGTDEPGELVASLDDAPDGAAGQAPERKVGTSTVKVLLDRFHAFEQVGTGRGPSGTDGAGGASTERAVRPARVSATRTSTAGTGTVTTGTAAERVAFRQERGSQRDSIQAMGIMAFQQQSTDAGMHRQSRQQATGRGELSIAQGADLFEQFRRFASGSGSGRFEPWEGENIGFAQRMQLQHGAGQIDSPHFRFVMGGTRAML
jgi:hypothetical protein